MKPPRFDYFAPEGLEDALLLLGKHREDAKVLAGGQSLVPLMNFRLARPRILVDLNRIRQMAYLERRDGGLAIGAMTRQRQLEKSEVVRQDCPLLYEAMPLIGHMQIRNRGTIGGSLAHADPAAELPAVMTALGARFVVRSLRGERVVPSEQFFVGYLTTSLEPDELLVEIRVPAQPPRTGSAFLEVSRRHGDFALVGVAAAIALDASGVCTNATLVFTGVGPVPARATGVGHVLAGRRVTADLVEEAATRAAAPLNPDTDLHASSAYRKHVAAVLARRAMSLAAARAESDRS